MSRFRLIIGLFLLLVSLSACRPRKVLSRGDMTDVLYDIHMTDALLEDGQLYQHPSWMGGMNEADFKDMAYQSVLRKHGINEEIFYASVSYYSKNLRLYTKIYADIDKRLQDYITEIENRKYNVPTLAQVLAGLKLDTLEVRKRYEYGLYRPDTVPVRRQYLSADSLPSYAAWCTRQWLYKPDKKSVRFSMVSHVGRIILSDTITAKDSVRISDTLSANTMDVLHSDASGKVSSEVVATQGRKLPPGNIRQMEKQYLLKERLRQQIQEKKMNKR